MSTLTLEQLGNGESAWSIRSKINSNFESILTTISEMGFVWCGTYSAVIEYNKWSVVYFNSALYISKISTIGLDPLNTSAWDFLLDWPQWIQWVPWVGAGDVLWPVTNTDLYIPQWDWANTKTLKNGIPTSTFAPALGADDNYVTDAEKVKLSNLSGTNTGDNAANTNTGLVHTTGAETIAGVKTFSDEVKITYWKWIFNTGYTIPALKTEWDFADTGGSDSTRITPAGSAVTSNMVYSWAVRNGSKWDFYVEWKQTVTGGQVLSWTWRLLDIWDDAAFYDVNSANTTALKWLQDATIGRLQLWTSAYVQWNGDGSMNLNGTVITSWWIELGHASDTTISRVSAGKIAVEGVNLLTTSSTETVTNKRVTKRVETVASSATPASNTDSYDVTKITGLAVAITSLTSGLTGTPVDWDLHLWSFTDNGTARAITPWASFENSTVSFPTTTVISTRIDVLCEWNSATSKWRVVATA